MGFLKKLFPSYNERELKKINKIVAQVNDCEAEFASMSDDELKNMTNIFKAEIDEATKSLRDELEEIKDDKDKTEDKLLEIDCVKKDMLDKILPRAFAVVRETSKRVLGLRHYDVQIIGGIVLHQGRIAEMCTGEGKTLVATLPAYLNALRGKGVHVVTVNEYLAQRDAEWMGKIFKFLGLTVGVNLHALNQQQKQAAYKCDIMYTTNNELGFDYLRDNMVQSKEQLVQRDLAFAIVDEVDSILIDEARTPLIISGRGDKSSDVYVTANRFVKGLHADDYELSEKDKTVYLNEKGAEKAEKYFHIDNLSDFENQDLKRYIDNALKAHFTMRKDANYMVVDGEVIIIDEFTGRKMIGRRYSNGLHQAIEAKEGVKIKSEDKTLATITFQNFFRLYEKLSGMTGTAKTEENEFKSIYMLDVVVVPTNKPVIRIDEQDKLYQTMDAKYKAVIEDVKKCHEKNQPVLIGTVNVDTSEHISSLLSKQGIKNNVLNAKNHEKEAEIVAQAGKKGAVTVATNMAGRGTDILLGGNPEFLAKDRLVREGVPHDIIDLATSMIKSEDEEIAKVQESYNKYFAEYNEKCKEEKEEVKAAGGLRIIGTERHESRRIDNQLRGRSGRQGDPGSSIFYLSMEDDMMRLFGGETMQAITSKLNMDPDDAIQVPIITRQIEHAQARVEDRNFSIRKHVIGYDDVVNKQRELIYEQRRLVLDGLKIHKQIMAMLKTVIERIVTQYADLRESIDDWDLEGFNKELERCVLESGSNVITVDFALENCSIEDLTEAVYKIAEKQYEDKAKLFEEKTGQEFDVLERQCLLRVVDYHWMEHIDAMQELKQGIGLVAYAQRDPLLVYKKEGFDMFEEMTENIQNETIRILLKSKFNFEEAERDDNGTIIKPAAKRANKPEKVVQVVNEAKVGRNDPCPCGSGKKYKNCCGKNL